MTSHEIMDYVLEVQIILEVVNRGSPTEFPSFSKGGNERQFLLKAQTNRKYIRIKIYITDNNIGSRH
jgi:hypothetical protein